MKTDFGAYSGFITKMIIQEAKNEVFGGIYERVREKEYLIERTALFGIFRWYEVVHLEKLGSQTIVEANSIKPIDKVLINGIEYVPKNPPKISSKN